MVNLQHLYNVNEESEVIPVIAYAGGDEIIHTPEYPYCGEQGCPCVGSPHEDEEEPC